MAQETVRLGATVAMILCVIYVVWTASITVNIMEIQITQIDTDNFRGYTTIYDHGGGMKEFWGTNHSLAVGVAYRITYRAGFIRCSILEIEVL